MRHLEEALEVLKLHDGDDCDDDCGGGATDGDEFMMVHDGCFCLPVQQETLDRIEIC